MTIVVTGANGQLGGAVIRHLQDKIPNDQIVASVRDPDKASGLGVEVRHGDFDRPETLAGAFAGADKLLVVSTDTFDYSLKLRQHTAAVDAAAKAGVKHIVYTSITAADTNSVVLAEAHRPTEQAIVDSGVPYTFLRNNWYFENDHGTIAGALATGTVATSSGEGRFAPALRDEYALAAAGVLATDGHQGAVYELGGAVSYSYAEWAAALATASGKSVTYAEITDEQARAGLSAAGLPGPLVEMLLSFYGALGRGEFDVPSRDLATLIGREPATLDEMFATALVATG
jgi:NAD(P)H dehydrogenase (quinone)